MKVLIADKFQSWGIDRLKDLGCDVCYEPERKDSTLRDAVARLHCDMLVVRSTKVDETILSASPALSLVVRAGAGYDTIDVEAASRNSIFVANCPGKNAVAVAELTLALILALDRRVVDNTVDLRNGVWNKSEYAQARGLKGRTLGIVGMGRIGQAVAARALAFEMNVAAWSRSLTTESAEQWGVEFRESPAAVAEVSDVLSLHVAATPETTGLIGPDVLARLKPGAYVINTSRHDVLDYHALRQVVREKGIRVGLDVYPDEPPGGKGEFHDDIIRAEGVVYGTHHIGASTEQAQDAIGEETVRIIRTFMQSGQVLNCVNVRSHRPTRCCLRVRHLNRPGVLAHVLHVVSHGGINVEEMENVICHGGTAACAQIMLDKPLSDDLIGKIRSGNENILGVSQMIPPA